MVDMKSLLTMQGMMFLMILIGAGMRKIQIVTTEGRRSMTNLVVNLILPSNILYAFSKADASAFRSMLVVVAMAFLIQLAWYLLSRVLWRGMDESRRGVMRYAFQFSNCGYLGNPVIEGLYGAPGSSTPLSFCCRSGSLCGASAWNAFRRGREAFGKPSRGR